MAALATLVYAPVPPQQCLGQVATGEGKGDRWQCDLEGLQDSLQWKYPTLWRALMEAVEATGGSGRHRASEGGEGGVLGRYLRWRGALFGSARGDTSLLEMLPKAQPKALRTLLRLSVQVRRRRMRRRRRRLMGGVGVGVGGAAGFASWRCDGSRVEQQRCSCSGRGGRGSQG